MTRTLSLEYGAVTLVLGLEWFALLDAAPSRVARRLAREHRASHMVVLDAFPGAVGLADLSSSQGLQHLRYRFRLRSERAKSRMHSAAQLFAHLYPSGSVAMLIEVQPDLMWLVAAHEGVIIARTDRLYAERDAGNVALAELGAAYPRLLILGGDGAPPCPALATLCQHASSASLLVPCPRWRGLALGPAIGIATFSMAMLFVATTGRLAKTDQAPSYRSGPSMPPASAAQSSEVSSLPLVHGVEGLQGLMHTFHMLPARMGGWSLERAQCDAASSRWRCFAQYRRSHLRASNKSLLRHAQAEWHITFPSMDAARVVWSPAAQGTHLDALIPMSTGHNDRHLLSALQAVQSGFTHFHVAASDSMRPYSPGQLSNVSPLPLLGASRADQVGANAVHAAGGYRSRGVSIAGPLRSASLLTDHAAFIGWTRAVLEHRPIDSPDVRRSSLNLSLEGTLYEIATQNDAMADDEGGGLDFLPDAAGRPGLSHES